MRLAILAAVLLASPAAAQDRGIDGYGYDREDRADRWRDRDADDYGTRTPRYLGSSYRLGGEGGRALDPWLAETPEGQRFMRLAYPDARNGRISRRTARHANTAFRRYADGDRDMRLTDAEIRIALVTLENSAAIRR